MSPDSSEIWLSLDLSSPSGSLALHTWRDNELRILYEKTITAHGNHSERLLPELDTALQAVRIPLQKVDLFVGAAGPGSFTGLRIAIATLKAFAYVFKRPIVTVSTSEAKALGWLSETQAKLQEGDGVLVITPISKMKHTEAFFLLSANRRLTCVGELALEPGKSPWKNPAGRLYVLGESERLGGSLYPNWTVPPQVSLRARHLALAAAFGESATRSKEFKEWVSLSPTYFGTSAIKKSRML